ncbi:acetyltransferase [Kiloniella sp.]|uniref:acetyltransferase n=1 Tax=Kiloniella sp. TaxID=1938587 RepID=UPI003A958CC8
MSQEVVIFGVGSLAEVAHYFLTHDSGFTVAGFVVHEAHLSQREFCGLPVVPFEEIEKDFPASKYKAFVAVGYKKLNKLREDIYKEFKNKGYECISYISSKATTWPNMVVGENVFILEDVTVQPFVIIGDNVFVWSGNHIGHHTRIEDHCFITSHVVISGHCIIGERSFLGVNSTISEGVAIASDNLIGPNSLIQKSTAVADAYIADRTPKFPKPSSRLFR